MDKSRRNFFSVGAAAVAAAAIPSGAVAVDKTIDEAVGPIMLEHVCDRGWNTAPQEYREYWEAEERRAGAPQILKGCGTRFRWFFGVPPICPNCGWMYELTLEILRSGRYKRISG